MNENQKKIVILKLLIEQLKNLNLLPKNIQLTQIGEVYVTSVFNYNDNKIISESIQTGFAGNPNLSAIKALIEYIERLAFESGKLKGLDSCKTLRTDGMAAFPVFLISQEVAKLNARENAYYECLERFLWSKWWDETDTSFTVQELSISNLALNENNYINSLLQKINENTSLESIKIITPQYENQTEESGTCNILIAKILNFGYISGGAAGKNSKIVLFRALSELYRHGLAIKRSISSNLKPQSFYEKRLHFFGLGKGNLLIENRLKESGNTIIKLPPLVMDEEIRHELEESVIVHRCLFENMPPFIGGHIERFCI